MHHNLARIIEKATMFDKVQSSIIKPLKIKKITPDITISRDPGSGGKLVAKLVAKKLDWQFFDKFLARQIAEELGIPAEEFVAVDENTRSWFSDTLQSLFNPNYVSDLKYISNLKKIIKKAAEETDIVALGRGANHILSPDKVLRVRVTASFSKRVANTVKHEGRDWDNASAWVRKVEYDRVRFIKQYFGANPYNPWHYDIVINTDHFSLEQAADIVIQAYLTKFPKEKRKLNKILNKK